MLTVRIDHRHRESLRRLVIYHRDVMLERSCAVAQRSRNSVVTFHEPEPQLTELAPIQRDLGKLPDVSHTGRLAEIAEKFAGKPATYAAHRADPGHRDSQSDPFLATADLLRFAVAGNSPHWVTLIGVLGSVWAYPMRAESCSSILPKSL